MQNEFDIWYREMCGEQQESVGAYIKIAKAAALDEAKNSEESTRSKQNRLSMGLTNNHSSSKIQMTGNKEADDDIIAFFKAKEALLARTKSIKANPN